MIREFVAGVVWGGVVAGVGLSVVSEIAPMPGKMVTAEAEVVAAAETPAGTEVAPKVEAPDVPAPEVKVAEAAPEAKAPDANAPAATAPAAAAPAEPAATEDPAKEPAEPVPAEPPASVADQAVAQPAAPETEAQPAAPAGEPSSPALAAPAASPAPDAAEAPPVAEPAPAAPEVAANPEAPAAVAPPSAPVEPAPKSEPPAPAEPAPTAEASLPAAPPPQTDESLLQPLPEAPAQPPVPPAPAEAAPGEAAAKPGLLADKSVDGVTVGRLPSISTDQPSSAEAAAGAGLTPGTDRTPLGRLKGTFQNPEGKPLFAVLLVDDGAPDLDRAKLAALPFPVTFVLDPLSPNAAEASATYRSAGQQVAMFGAGIPKGATPADVEQTFQTLAAAVPEAVAVVDPGAGGFQDDRKLAAAVVPILKEQGRGLITFDQGLNAADQVARREDLPSATIFRTLDDEGEDTPLIRRYLDRAAFKAAQEGQVMVLGSAKPETVAALLEWAVEGKAATVALAPVSALLEGK